MDIVEIRSADTHALRRSVLRDGTPGHDVIWDGDDDPTTFHLGVSVGGEIVAISSWMWRPCPDLPGHGPNDTAIQLRGMATALPESLS